MKHSKQRTAILEDLHARYDHPTAEMVYLTLQERFPNISLGTVYRNLALLCELGEIIKVGADEDGKEHYDGHIHPHSHFFCETCGTIYDLDVHIDMKALEAELSAEIRTCSTAIRGKCRHCLSKN